MRTASSSRRGSSWTRRSGASSPPPAAPACRSPSSSPRSTRPCPPRDAARPPLLEPAGAERRLHYPYHPPVVALLLAPAGPPHVARFVLRDLPRHGEALLLAHQLDGHRLTRLVGAQDPHRVRRAAGFAPADRQDHVPALHGEARIGRGLHDQQAFLRTEVLAQVGIQADELQVAPRHTERELEVLHVGHGGHGGHAGHHPDVRRPTQVFSDERGLLGVAPPAVLYRNRVTRLELTGQLHELSARPRFLLVLHL